MVTMTIPVEVHYSGFLNLVGSLIEKLGVKSYLFYIHSSYVYFFVMLAVLALIACLVVRRVRRKNAVPCIQESACAEEEEDPIQAEEEPVPETQEVPAIETVAQPRILAAAHQHIGTRQDQQDSYGVSDPAAYPEKGIIAVVADGMGGLANGRAVSSALVRSLLDGYANANPRQNSADFLLEQAVRANAGVNKMLQGQERSGSTLVSCVIRDGYLHFLTVGDSRIYLYRGGAVIQLNREHIYQEELAVKAVNQQASLQQVYSDRQAHALTSYFGIGQLPAVDRNDQGLKLLSGDKIVLASDGVFGTLTQAQLEAALAQSVKAAARTMDEQIRAANRTHQDNNTAVILEYRV